MNKIDQKRQNEKKLITQMIGIYCKSQHKTKGELCECCDELLTYSLNRINRCPFMEEKTFCSNCKVHCYKKDQRDKIKKVMAFSGKRMIFYHPIIAINHVIQMKKQKKIIKQQEIDNEKTKQK